MKNTVLFVFTILISLPIFGQVYILNEDFVNTSGTTPPFEWTNYTINGTATDLWHFDNPGDRVVNYPITSPFAIFDGDTVSVNGQSEKVALESPFFDASISDFILLMFDQTFASTNGAVAIIESFDGTSWTEVKRFTTSTVNSASEIVDISAIVGGITNAKIRFVWDGQSHGYWALDNISILAPLPIDGGLVKLDSPVAPFNEGVQPIKITIGNYGYQNLTSTTIKWEMNGVQQPNYTWNGNLSIGQIQENVQIGSYNFTGNQVQVMIWQTLPNGLDDLNPSNDSVVTIIQPALCGDYTIGGSNPDFETFTEATTALINAGITCPVIFKIRDGIYNEQIIINNIEGSSETNSVTFQSESGDSSVVILQSSLDFRNISYLNFKQIHFSGAIISNSTFIQIDNCLLTNGSIAINDNSNNVVIRTNNFDGGGIGIVINSSGINIKIIDNLINNKDYTGNYCGIGVRGDCPNLKIIGNDIRNMLGMHGQAWGISFTAQSDSVFVLNNSISNSDAGINIVGGPFIVEGNKISGNKIPRYDFYGINANCSNSIIANNYILSDNNYITANGLQLNQCNNTTFAFNTVNIIRNNANSKSLQINGGDNLLIENNILSNKPEGYAAYITILPTNLVLDYNDYYSASNKIGFINDTTYSSISSWSDAINGEIHGVFSNPSFTNDTTYNPNQILINNTGTSIPNLIYDIDSSLRNQTSPDIGAKEFSPCTLDAGINFVTAPILPLIPGIQDIKVVLQNQGTSTFTSVTIHWTINEMNQIPYQWNGSLTSAQNIEVIIGQFDFLPAVSYKIKCWSSLPDGVADCNQYNDTITSNTLYSKLCGTYTIGGTNPDFETFTEAVGFLNYAGISCQVVFKVRNGIYDERIEINYILGSSVFNTITFESESGDSSLVVIQPSVYGNYISCTALLNGVNNLIFNKLSFTGNGDNNGIRIDNHSANIKVSSCILNCPNASSAISTLNQSSNIMIEKSYIQGYYSGIYTENVGNIKILNNVIRGNNEGVMPFNQTSKLLIQGNNFANSGNGVRFYNGQQDSATIINNTFENHTVGITIPGGNGPVIISNNTMKNIRGYGIVADCSNSLFYNNFIQINGVEIAYGFYSQNANNNKIQFNTINVKNSNGSSSAFYINGGSNQIIENNILANQGQGYSNFVTTFPTSSIWDYNDYYSFTNKIGFYNDTICRSLSSWSAITGGDSHSFSITPFFVADTIPMISQSLLNNTGFPIANISYDIDSTLRNLSNPDIGAKEFSPCAQDAGINSVIAPILPLIPGIQDIKVVLQNQGTSTFTSVTIHWTINEINQIPYQWSGSLTNTQNIEVIIGQFDFLPAVSYKIKCWSSLPDGVADCNQYNDTITSNTLYSKLCGTYTIGGNNADLISFNDAVGFLNNAGITCPVVFKVRNGTYNELVEIEKIDGSSLINTVTFESESDDSSSVYLSGGTTKLSGVSHVVFSKLHLGKVTIANQAHDIKLNNCLLTGGDETINISGGSKDIVVNKCRIKDGAWRGIWLVDCSNIRIMNNKIASYANQAILSNNWQNHSLLIQNNEIAYLPQTYAQGEGINVAGDTISIINNTISGVSGSGIAYSGNGPSIISGNKINFNMADRSFTGIYITSTITTVSNNYISCGGNLAIKGIVLSDVSNSTCLFNSININNTNIGSRAFELTNGINLLIKNNIFSNTGAGFASYISVLPTNLVLDYNDYYSASNNIGFHNGTTYTTLSSWGSAIVSEANGKNLNPYFANDSSYKVYQRGFNGAGIPVSDVLLDIEGKIRNDQAPDIGAWEFMVDFGITQLISPNLDCTHGVADSVTVYLRQFGDIPFIDLRLAYQVNGGAVYLDTIPGTIYNDLTYTFKTPVNMSTEGAYFFRVWLINTRDDNLNNDTLVTTRYTKPAPVVDFTFDNQCSGREVHFSGIASVLDPYFIERYEWIFGTGDTARIQNPVYIFPLTGSYSVTMKAYSNAGCYNEITKAVTLSDYEKMEFNLTAKNEICNNSCNGEVDIEILGGESPLQLYFNNETTTQAHFGNLCTGIYSVHAIDNLGCEATDTVFITTDSPMALAIMADPIQGFAPLDVNLSAIVSGVESYEWYYKGSLIDTESSTSITLTEPDSQYIKLKVSSGPPNYCTLEDSIQIQVDVFVDIRIPNAFTPNGDGYNDTFGPVTEGIKTLEMDIKDRNGRLVHTIEKVDGRWDGNMPSGSEAPQGIYYYVMNAVGYDDLNYTRQGSVNLFRDLIDLSPNPVANKATLDLTGKFPGEKKITIYNASGIPVKNWITSENVIEMDLSNLASGLYMLKACIEGQVIVVKFIKE